jgi:tRNA threonylcarbamoyladenosine biosynthesis protein TsaE
MSQQVQSLSAADTLNFGKQLGKILKGGDVICLIGDLGAGKTALAKGIGEALGIEKPMTSPTFTFIQEYSGFAHREPIRLIHMDLYRLQNPEEVEVIGVEDAFQEDTICLIEWPEIAQDYLPEDRLELRIEGSGEEPRNFTLQPRSKAWEERLKEDL